MKVQLVICALAAVFSALCCIAVAQETCTGGQVYSTCHTGCPLTCDNYQNPPLVCPSVCVSGCACPRTAPIMNRQGQCVTLENIDCSTTSTPSPPTCSNGMVYSTCASCLLSCDNYTTAICPLVCRAGCSCPTSTPLFNNGRCIASSECPTAAPTTPPDVCSLPRVTGPCNAAFRRFFFNSTSRTCQPFTYGGCGANDNNFNTNDECVQRCDPCALVRCARPAVCPNGDTPTTPTGQCCPVCPNPPSCPKDVSVATCFADPCSGATCPNQPNARCVPNFCGQCSAEFYNSSGSNVTANCTSRPTTCPDGRPPVSCFADPCLGRTCPGVTGARCVANYCGGCNAVFYDSEGNNVTARCTSTDVCSLPPVTGDCDAAFRRFFFNRTAGFCQPFTYGGCQGNGNNFNTGEECLRTCASSCAAVSCARPNCPNGDTPITPEGQCCPVCPTRPTTPPVVTPTVRQAEVCPAISEGLGDICSQQCSGDNSCPDGMKCCSNGCGTACMMPDRVPYYDIPLQCPQNEPDRLGICTAQTNNSCQSDNSCRGNQICCRSGCGRVCTTPINATQPCFAITDLFNISGGLGAAVGSFIPRCDTTDGSFNPIQCHGSTGYCWCVHTRTGRPLSSPQRGMPRCSLNCTYNGNTYYPGQSYASTDGCNNCWCTDTGVTACTRRACVDNTCSLAPERGMCRGAFPAYYYDASAGSSGGCRNFTYGGCGGNDNKFETIGDCLSRCDRNSRCLLRRDPGPCEALFPSFFFNATSGRCERFNYGGCQGNENRFTTAQECQRECDPSRPVDPCLTAPCPLPPCPESQRIRIPGECCAQCQRCDDDEFTCSNGSCIPGSRRCDGLNDCSNGEDEAECPYTCDFMCGDGVCIPERYVCDDYLDCRDGSDARNCPIEFDNTFFPQDIPQQCPNATGLIGACVVECEGDDDCENGGLCCSNGCGRTCMRGEPVTPLCPALLRQTDPAVIGAFVPSCEREGSFSQIQCHGSTGYCWCVDTATGQPQSNGVRGEPDCGVCNSNGIVYTIGENFLADDGCNTCYCSSAGPICTRRACVPNNCTVTKGVTISHNKNYSDDCSNCSCQFGRLQCERKQCPLVKDSPGTKPTNVTMKFRGDLQAIAPSDDHKEELKREVMRTFIDSYKDSLGFKQEQIKGVDLKSGSVIVIVTLNDTTTQNGANLTILLNQLVQDYMSGTFFIRYNSQVLDPVGDIQVGETNGGDNDEGFPLWGIIVICVGGVLLIMLVVVVLAGVIIGVTKSKPSNYSSYRGGGDNDYEASYKNGSVDVKPRM